MATLTLLISVVLFATVSADLAEIIDSEKFPGLDECGFETAQRIVGGTDTIPGEFPWVAALEYNHIYSSKSAGIKCSGFVINKRYVLTAGRCLYKLHYDLFQVWLGVWKISTAETTDNEKVKKFGIETKILHGEYDRPPWTHDIGMLRLNADITYTDYIRPICLPIPDLELPPYGTQLTVTGWGTIENDTSSDIKLKVDVSVVENIICLGQLGAFILDNQMCAGSEAGRDACFGDAGGPLMMKVKDPKTGKSHWFPHGMFSYSDRECGQKGVPSAYTRISKFMDWIIKKVK